MDYNQIVLAAKAYADRNDIEVNANIDNFILLAEAKINRVLKTAGQSKRVYTASVDDREFYTLPDEYNGMRTIHFNSGSVNSDNSDTIQMHYVTPEQVVDMQQNAQYGDKLYFTILNNQVQVVPCLPSGGTIEMVFYRKVPNLSATNTENWASIDHPDIYISAITAEIELFAKNYDAATLWNSRLLSCIDEIDNNDVDNRWAGNTMTIKVG